jgi:signal transduction histidine kinase
MIQTLSHGTGLREDVRDQMERFYGLLEQSIESGSSDWLDTIISEWANALTQSDLEQGTNNLTKIIENIMLESYNVTREHLPENQALELIIELTSCFTHSFEVAAACEMEARVAYVSNQLSQVRQTLERLDRSKSDFIAVAAHELKTPLTLVEGYSAMLRDSVEKRPDGKSDLDMLTGILNGTRRLRAIVDDMIDVSMIDNNLLSIHYEPLWLNRIIECIKGEVANVLKERNLNLICRDFEGGQDMLFGDPERIMQVFRNVLSNAIKFTPDGGEIVFDGRKLPGFIEVTVADTGIGIDPEDQTYIFEKFTLIGDTALHSSGKTKFKGGGPGLGLHIAKGIIESHGGAIWVESPGRDETCCPGSIFHIMIPARTEPPDDKTAKLFRQQAVTTNPSEVIPN